MDIRLQFETFKYIFLYIIIYDNVCVAILH